ncbi:MAG: Glu/Leu/Phe/Val dehydrogenase [Candidatus Liptonbacteria bacterium]|nr:Glu/Leu/Phe/Val dehydrogenase [Candidatus Liptonbacteria bacterium]
MKKILLDASRLPEFDNHELVAFTADRKSGLKSFIAIHNTNLGPATGGTRYWAYDSEEEAFRDVLRLSRAMTYKCALARVPYGGGKGVIIANSHHPRRRKILAAYAKRVNLLEGSFYTGEDVGITPDDISVLARQSHFIIGREKFAGDPSPWAALGVFFALQAGLEVVFGNADITGRTFAVKGLGKVGGALCELLYRRGGTLIGADIDPDRVRSAKRRFPRIKIVEAKEIHRQRVDVYAPCALGGDFNKKTIPQLRCQVICGGANNQLSSEKDGERLHGWGILYIPDYLANAGGLINVVSELDKRGYSSRRVRKKVKDIRKTAKKIIMLSEKLNKPTSDVADRLAERIFKNGKRRKK